MFERYGYGTYITVAERAKMASDSAKKALKKNQVYVPVVIEGRAIAVTWWGKAWNENLERYADYASRISRGKSYVRSGAVIDLKIEKGIISAKVQGSKKTPYKVVINIDPLSGIQYENILKVCSNQIDSMEALIDGRFPEEMTEQFLQKGSGLFPSPKEIHFNCNCPDWASMCKHVAAVLYGVGNRLDSDPILFFSLRDIDMDGFIKKSVEEKMNSMLEHADHRSERVIPDDQLQDLFGVF